jgi:predicted signal transduction protein with EAL and GGDEF domain
MLFRIGGDEFALLAEDSGAAARALQFAERALDCLTLPINISGRLLRVGASIGVASDDDGTMGPFELLRRGDTAMYNVKANGKGGIKVYEPSLDQARIWRHQIEQEIVNGLNRCEFDVHYQPLVDARSSETVGVEALIRWPGRPGGPLDPDQFIGVAEGSGLIQALGMYVLERACRETRPFENLRLSVNVSPTQFSHPDFERQVTQILRLTDFAPERLQIEITERHLIDYPERARLAIDALRALGVGFALDDFGTGFTSLAYLQSYGFSCVKIDRSLTKRLESDPQATYLISGLVQLAKGLNLSVVAEGVENERLALLLAAAGCNELQGYHFGRPAPLGALSSGESHQAGATEAA